MATLGYVGSNSTHLPIQCNLNLPAQDVFLNSEDYYEARSLSSVAAERWRGISTVRTIRNNNYNAMNAELRIRE